MSQPLDGTGRPIRPDDYVRVAYESQHYGVRKFRGIVAGFRSDRQGPLIEVLEWRDGKHTGKTRIARPEHCKRAPKPPSVRAHQAEADRLGTREARLAELDKELRARRARARKKGRRR